MLPRVWDRFDVLLSMAGVLSGVNVGALTLAVGGAFDDEGVGAGGEPVDGGLGEEGVGGHGQPFGGFSVGDPDGAGFAVTFDDDFVEVVGLGGVQGA